MGLDTYNVTRPNARNGGTDPFELIIEEFTGLVEGTIERKSVLKGFVPLKTVKGTSTVTNYGVGESTLGKLTPGETPDGTLNDFSKISVTVDTVVNARAVLPLLDVFQTQFDSRAEIAAEHGKKIAKFWDQSFFIQAAKAAALATSTYGSAGHHGGSTEVLDNAADRTDPAKLYAAIANLFTKMEEKDVDPRMDDVMIALRPEQYYTLLQAEQIVNGEYVTAAGTKIDTGIFKSFGVPVVSTNNVPNTNIVDHLLSNTGNGAAYDGDFSNVVALAFSPRALLAGETIPLQSKIFFDDLSKHWFVDAWLAYGVTPNRPEFSGSILLP